MVAVGVCPMQAVAEQSSLPTFPEVISFPLAMVKPKPKLAAPTLWQRHGNTAQISGVLITLFLTLWFHWSDSQSKASDEHTNSLISEKLQPAVKQIGDDLDKKLSPIANDLSTLKLDMAGLNAKMEQLNADLSRSTKLQLDKLSQQIAMARNSGRVGN